VTSPFAVSVSVFRKLQVIDTIEIRGVHGDVVQNIQGLFYSDFQVYRVNCCFKGSALIVQGVFEIFCFTSHKNQGKQPEQYFCRFHLNKICYVIRLNSSKTILRQQTLPEFPKKSEKLV